MGFTDWIKDAFNTVTDLPSKIYGGIKDGISSAIDATKAAANWTAQAAKDAGAWTVQAAKDTYSEAKNAVTTVYEDVKGGVNKSLDILSSPFTMIAIAIVGIAVISK